MSSYAGTQRVVSCMDPALLGAGRCQVFGPFAPHSEFIAACTRVAVASAQARNLLLQTDSPRPALECQVKIIDAVRNRIQPKRSE